MTLITVTIVLWLLHRKEKSDVQKEHNKARQKKQRVLVRIVVQNSLLESFGIKNGQIRSVDVEPNGDFTEVVKHENGSDQSITILPYECVVLSEI
jgi:hypothetical protein